MGGAKFNLVLAAGCIPSAALCLQLLLLLPRPIAPPVLKTPPPALPPPAPSPRRQVNAFCNTDDITWGTKNLDTKKDATEAKTLMKSGLAYSANQVGAVAWVLGVSSVGWILGEGDTGGCCWVFGAARSPGLGCLGVVERPGWPALPAACCMLNVSACAPTKGHHSPLDHQHLYRSTLPPRPACPADQGEQVLLEGNDEGARKADRH